MSNLITTTIAESPQFHCSVCQRVFILPTCCNHYQENQIKELKYELEISQRDYWRAVDKCEGLEKQITLYKKVTDAFGFKIDGGIIYDTRFK